MTGTHMILGTFLSVALLSPGYISAKAADRQMTFAPVARTQTLLTTKEAADKFTLQCRRHRAAYRYRSSYVRRNSRGRALRTALTIAAPAALGAGIGALAGGKKGAGVGALLGGGGGALYRLFRDR